MELRLYKNNMGLEYTEDKHWAIRQVGKRFWAVQYRDDPNDAWAWQILGYEETKELAVAHMVKARERKHEAN